jgi:hypothetical protein
MVKLLLLSLLIVSLALLGMAITLLIRKNGKFPDSSVGKNKEMRKLGIHCARHEEIKCRRDIDKGNCACHHDLNARGA